jgi:hypothetical protein
LSYADRLLYLPIGLIGMALATPLYTRLAHYARAKNTDGFESTMLLGLCASVALGVPLAAYSWGLAEPGIALVLWRGAFEATDVVTSAQALRGYAPAIVFLSMLPLAQSAAFAQGHHWRGVPHRARGRDAECGAEPVAHWAVWLAGHRLCDVDFFRALRDHSAADDDASRDATSNFVAGRDARSGHGVGCVALVLWGLGAATVGAWARGLGFTGDFSPDGDHDSAIAFAFFARPMWAPLVPKIRALRHRVARAATQEVPGMTDRNSSASGIFKMYPGERGHIIAFAPGSWPFPSSRARHGITCGGWRAWDGRCSMLSRRRNFSSSRACGKPPTASSTC